MHRKNPKIDTLRVGGEIVSMDTAAENWQIHTKTTKAGIEESGRIRSMESGARLHVVGGKAWMEGSVPKALQGVNFPAATVDDAQEIVGAWFAEASQFVTYEDRRALRVNRVDVVRDFRTESGAGPSDLIGGLAETPIMGQKSKAHFQDPSLHHARTLYVKTKRAGSGRMYDKFAESKLEEAKGVLRFEAQERVRSIRGAGAITFGDLTAPVLDTLGRSRFAWCGFDVPVSGWDQWLLMTLGNEEITDGTKLQLIGFASLRRSGFDPLMERTRSYRLRKLLMDNGVPAKTEVRLDYDEGLIAA